VDWRLRDILIAGLLLWSVLGGIAGCFFGTPYRPIREGEPCGPGHVWTAVWSGVDGPDFSCEPERKPPF